MLKKNQKNLMKIAAFLAVLYLVYRLMNGRISWHSKRPTPKDVANYMKKHGLPPPEGSPAYKKWIKSLNDDNKAPATYCDPKKPHPLSAGKNSPADCKGCGFFQGKEGNAWCVPEGSKHKLGII